MLKNSVLTTLISTVISVGLSFLLAFCIHRSGIRFKSIWSILFTIPMLIPSISHGMGLVLLFGDNGILTNLLGINIGPVRLYRHYHGIGNVFVPGFFPYAQRRFPV